MRKKILLVTFFFALVVGGYFYVMSPFQRCVLLHGGAYTEEVWGRLRFHLPACWSYETNSDGSLYISPIDAEIKIYEENPGVRVFEDSTFDEAPKTLRIGGKEFLEYNYFLQSYYVPTYFEDPIAISLSFRPYEVALKRYPDLATIFGSFEEVPVEMSPTPSEPVVVPADSDFSRETSFADAGSVLAPDLVRGIDYEAMNVFDRDVSTAWCRGDYDSGENGPFAGTLTLQFSEPVGGKTIGIMPGFASSEELFWKNNRIKTLVVSDGPSALLSDATLFEFQDKFEMQYFELPTDAGRNIVLAVQHVFPGSLYDDTCIAEIDLWDIP